MPPQDSGPTEGDGPSCKTLLCVICAFTVVISVLLTGAFIGLERGAELGDYANKEGPTRKYHGRKHATESFRMEITGLDISEAETGEREPQSESLAAQHGRRGPCKLRIAGQTGDTWPPDFIDGGSGGGSGDELTEAMPEVGIVEWWEDDCGKRDRDPFPEQGEGTNDTDPGRLIIGEKAQPGDYPWYTYLLTRLSNGTTGSCSAALINNRWILTAAYCVYKYPARITVTAYIGALYKQDEQAAFITDVDQCIIHETFHNESTDAWDIVDMALLRIAKPDALPKPENHTRYNIICLIEESMRNKPETVYEFAGMGMLSRKVTSRQIYKGQGIYSGQQACDQELDQSRLCSQSEKGGTCTVGSGSPWMIHENGRVYQIGVHKRGGLGDCESELQYNVAEDVGLRRDWILNTINKNTD